MLRLPGIFRLPTLLFASLVARAVALPDGLIAENKDEDERRPEYATALTGGEGCSPPMIDEIRSGFAEMTSLFLAAVPYDPNGQPAVELFGSPLKIGNYTAMIEANLQRAAQYANIVGGPGSPNSDIHIRCDDPIKICNVGNPREGRHAAYNIGNDPHINFCDDYFKLEGLDEKVEKKVDNQAERERLHEYYNRGMYMG